jgi:ribosomal protein L16 Arg81 hydroxylase
LQPSRVPFEESTVWAQTNLHSKSPAVWSSEAWSVVLNPGDLLYVPHHW